MYAADFRKILTLGMSEAFPNVSQGWVWYWAHIMHVCFYHDSACDGLMDSDKLFCHVLYPNRCLRCCSAPTHPCASNAVTPSSHTRAELGSEMTQSIKSSVWRLCQTVLALGRWLRLALFNTLKCCFQNNSKTSATKTRNHIQTICKAIDNLLV